MNNKLKFLKGNILFDDKELAIMYDSKTYGLNILLSILLLISSTINAINFYNSGKQFLFYAFFVIAMACLVFFGISLYTYLKSKMQRGNWIKVADIKSISYREVVSNIKVEIAQNDCILKRVTIINDSDFWQFIDTMKKKGIEVNKT